VGANDHYIRFDSGGTKKVALKKLRPQDWAVLALPAEQEAQVTLQRRDELRLPPTAPEAACEAAGTRRDTLPLPHTATDAECEAAEKKLEERKQAAAKQRERERDAEAAGTKVSLPASATACAATIFPI
jgi:hypothetical protein